MCLEMCLGMCSMCFKMCSMCLEMCMGMCSVCFKDRQTHRTHHTTSTPDKTSIHLCLCHRHHRSAAIIFWSTISASLSRAHLDIGIYIDIDTIGLMERQMRIDMIMLVRRWFDDAHVVVLTHRLRREWGVLRRTKCRPLVGGSAR